MTILEKMLVFGLIAIVIAGSVERYQASIVKEELVRSDIQIKRIFKALNDFYAVRCVTVDPLNPVYPNSNRAALISAGFDAGMFVSPWGTSYDTNIQWLPAAAKPRLQVSLDVTTLNPAKRTLIEKNDTPEQVTITSPPATTPLLPPTVVFTWETHPDLTRYGGNSHINTFHASFNRWLIEAGTCG